MGNNIIRVIKGLKIDPQIFIYKFRCRCTGECCHYGVYTDLKEYEKIISIKEELLSTFDESQTKNVEEWFEPAEKDEDFDSGIAVGTQVVNKKCTFLDKNGLCSLQKYANSTREYKWKYKPLYCILFPFTVYDGFLTIDDEHIDRLRTCNKEMFPETTIFEACKEELLYYFGEENFAELEKYREEFLNEIKLGETINVKE
jgi:Fe-S-cluster containining protein